MEAAKQIAGGVSTNPKDLDDDEEEEAEGESVLSLRELFWDKLALFLATAIVALSGVNIFTDLLRGGSNIACFIPGDLNTSDSQDAFIHNFCAQSIPITQYLPIFLLVHGILIGLCHFMWKSSFNSHLGFFFSLAKGLIRLREEITGAYPTQNVTIIKRLELEFSSYRRRRVFTWYQLKIIAQFLVAVASLLVSFLVFTDFNVEFKCPRGGASGNTATWPYPDLQVDCIFTSLRLFALVRIVDALFLALIIVILLWGILWTLWRHPQELNAKNIALFAFTTGLDGLFFVPRSVFGNPLGFFRGLCSRRAFEELKLRFFTPRIRTDLDFFLLLLYRTDSGLAHSFREGQIYLEHKALMELDHQLIKAKDEYDEGDIKDKKVERQLEKIMTGWSLPRNAKKTFQTVAVETPLLIPDNIRGAVMGLSLRAPANHRAIDVSFGSLGFSNALVRIFDLVGSLNFDPSYKDENETTKQTFYTTSLIGYRCYDDIFARSSEHTEFTEKTNDLWDDDARIDFMVIGPIAALKHVATAKHLLNQWEYSFYNGSVLVILQPTKIEGSNGKKQFYHFYPPQRLFEQFDPVVDVTDRPLDWPGASRMQSPTSRGEISLQCGNTVCQFRVSCYKFIGEEEDSDDEDDKEDDNEEKEDEEDGGDPNKDEKAVDDLSSELTLKAGGGGEVTVRFKKVSNLEANLEKSKGGRDGKREQSEEVQGAEGESDNQMLVVVKN